MKTILITKTFLSIGQQFKVTIGLEAVALVPMTCQ